MFIIATPIRSRPTTTDETTYKTHLIPRHEQTRVSFSTQPLCVVNYSDSFQHNIPIFFAPFSTSVLQESEILPPEFFSLAYAWILKMSPRRDDPRFCLNTTRRYSRYNKIAKYTKIKHIGKKY